MTLSTVSLTSLLMPEMGTEDKTVVLVLEGRPAVIRFEACLLSHTCICAYFFQASLQLLFKNANNCEDHFITSFPFSVG